MKKVTIHPRLYERVEQKKREMEKPWKVLFKNSHLGTEWRVIASFETEEEAIEHMNSFSYHIDSHYKVQKQ